MSVFYVYQGNTYQEERNGGYLWSPKLNKSGGKNVGYTMMTKVKQGDFILHNCNGKIVAISIAKADCYDSRKPAELNTSRAQIDWNSDGYRVDTEYFDMDTALKVTDYKDWLAKHYKDGSAFTVKGTGKQQYLCAINDDQAIYLLEMAMKLQNTKETKDSLRNALQDIVEDKDSEYDQIDKDEIDEIVDSTSGNRPEWTGQKRRQEMTTSTATGRKKPKRDTKIAADVLAHADYLCEYDNADRTFLRKSGRPYTEPHHLIPISKYNDFKYSVDAMENIVSLCSHCHNLLHYGRLEDKKVILKKLYDERIDALKTIGLDLSFDQLMSYYK